MQSKTRNLFVMLLAAVFMFAAISSVSARGMGGGGTGGRSGGMMGSAGGRTGSHMGTSAQMGPGYRMGTSGTTQQHMGAGGQMGPGSHMNGTMGPHMGNTQSGVTQ